MYVIAVYDICTLEPEGSKRLNKTMKTFRKYLHHAQLSVFEGEISHAKLMALYKELENIIDKNEDQVKFFIISNKNNLKKKVLGIQSDVESSII